MRVFVAEAVQCRADTASKPLSGHGGVRPLIEICQSGDSVSQTAAAGTLKNLSAVPEVRQSLSEEGIIRVMINLLDSGIVLGSKEYAAECLQNLSASNESLRRCIISEGGIKSLLNYMARFHAGTRPVAAVEKSRRFCPIDTLLSLGFFASSTLSLTDLLAHNKLPRPQYAKSQP
ncbi:uncharacterized protein A4U43_C10F9640 [Asparagus officinalis]|uniref:Armadillo repeat-containing domain-containing protein n=1 Tax=Asparagus officinalis TaxID=4686 RepID=A0A5P1E254_ASPOF|nr:uncharacterized protein A4U43_C10F9640 [Asparagus officinalis]